MAVELDHFQTIGILMFHGRDQGGWCTRSLLIQELAKQGIKITPDFIERLLRTMIDHEWIEVGNLHGLPAYRFIW